MPSRAVLAFKAAGSPRVEDGLMFVGTQPAKTTELNKAGTHTRIAEWGPRLGRTVEHGDDLFMEAARCCTGKSEKPSHESQSASCLARQETPFP